MTPRLPRRSRNSRRFTAKDDGIAGSGTIDALNRGAQHYEQLIIINMERAKRLPAPEEQPKYAVVDAGDTRLSMWENGRKVDEMKIVVGKAETATPMMAAYIKYASVNPYWNVPPELVRDLIGPRIAAQGVSYLTDREYQVLTSYSDDAQIIDPHTVDWQGVVDGRVDVRLRRLPSPANSMGMMKFMLPNYFGIYLHDSRRKIISPRTNYGSATGASASRITSGSRDGCSADMSPRATIPRSSKRSTCRSPVPVYMTYLTVQPTATGVQFLPDPYGRDAHPDGTVRVADGRRRPALSLVGGPSAAVTLRVRLQCQRMIYLIAPIGPAAVVAVPGALAIVFFASP